MKNHRETVTRENKMRNHPSAPYIVRRKTAYPGTAVINTEKSLSYKVNLVKEK